MIFSHVYNKAAVLPAALKGRVYEKVLYHICDAINIANNFEQTLSLSLKKHKISKLFIISVSEHPIPHIPYLCSCSFSLFRRISFKIP